MNTYVEEAKNAIRNALGGDTCCESELARVYGQILAELENQLDYCMKCLAEKEDE